MLFALSVGVAASAVIRRTIPAMAVTLVGYAAARIPIHWIRGRFWPATSRTYTTSFSTLLQNPTGPLRGNFPSTANGWVQTITITDPSGNTVPPDGGNLDVLSNYCPGLKTGSPPGQVTQHTGTPTGTLHPSLGPSSVPAAPPPSAADLTACKPKVQNLSLHEKIRYHPASHFWLIQTVETAIFLGLAALLVSAAILAVTRYRPT